MIWIVLLTINRSVFVNLLLLLLLLLLLYAIERKHFVTENELFSEHYDIETVTLLESLRYGEEDRLAEVVYDLSSSVDRKLLSLMNDRFELSRHLLALKKFILLGQVS